MANSWNPNNIINKLGSNGKEFEEAYVKKAYIKEVFADKIFCDNLPTNSSGIKQVNKLPQDGTLGELVMMLDHLYLYTTNGWQSLLFTNEVDLIALGVKYIYLDSLNIFNKDSDGNIFISPDAREKVNYKLYVYRGDI